MTGVVRGAALVCTVLGLVSAAAVLVRTRDARLALAVLLDFLLAAGLLRLVDPDWRALLTAAIVVAVRKLVVGVGLRPRSLR